MRSRFSHRRSRNMVSKWRMSGSLLGECNCDWGCPCSFDAPPTHGGCRGVYTWVIDKGAYGDVKLDASASLYLEYGPGRSTSAMARSSCSSTPVRRPHNGR